MYAFFTFLTLNYVNNNYLHVKEALGDLQDAVE